MQGDLFEISSAAQPANPASKFAFLERMRLSLRLDQTIVGLIALVIIYVLVFSFGVEKGKRFAMEELRAERTKRQRMVRELGEKIFEIRQAAEINQAQSGVKAKTPGVAAAPAALNPKDAQEITPIKTSSPAAPVVAGGKQFTIQLVTFTSKTLAEQQVKKLSEKGYNSFVIPSGKHLQVCVNTFSSREDAVQDLKKLRTGGIVPADAFVRPVS